jgi:hypothetical protein
VKREDYATQNHGLRKCSLSMINAPALIERSIRMPSRGAPRHQPLSIHSNRAYTSPPHNMTYKATVAESLREAHAALRAGRAATAERSLRALDAQFPG